MEVGIAVPCRSLYIGSVLLTVVLGLSFFMAFVSKAATSIERRFSSFVPFASIDVVAGLFETLFRTREYVLGVNLLVLP